MDQKNRLVRDLWCLLSTFKRPFVIISNKTSLSLTQDKSWCWKINSHDSTRNWNTQHSFWRWTGWNFAPSMEFLGRRRSYHFFLVNSKQFLIGTSRGEDVPIRSMGVFGLVHKHNIAKTNWLSIYIDFHFDSNHILGNHKRIILWYGNRWHNFYWWR